MRRLTALTAFALLAAAPAAHAAPLGELPFTPVPKRGPAICLERTGPASLALHGASSGRQTATDLLVVTGAGVTRTVRARIGRLFACPQVAEAPSSASVIAGPVARAPGFRFDVRAAVRAPGGGFNRSVRLSTDGFLPAAAVSPAGHTVVAWIERAGEGRFRAVAARREPGGAFEPAQTLATWRGRFPDERVEAAVDASGTATVAWAREVRRRDGGGSRFEVAVAEPGAPFVAQRLTPDGNYSEVVALDVAPDGWTLLAYEGGPAEAVVAFERAPGGARFTPIALPEPAGHVSVSSPVVAVRQGGGAVVAWRASVVDVGTGVDAVVRPAAGAFSDRQVVVGPRADSVYARDGLGFDAFDPLSGPPLDLREHTIAAAVGADGRVLLAWTAGIGGPSLRAAGAYAAAGRLDGGFEPVQRLGAPLRDTDDVAPLFLADGRTAVAWTDSSPRARDGRLHLAVEGAAAPAPPPAPRLTVHPSPPQRLFDNQPVRVDVSCDRACDLRAALARTAPTGVTRLAGGRRSLDLGDLAGPIGRPGASRRVRAVVRASAPGGVATVERSRRVRVIRRAPLPVRAPLAVRARRRGRAINVTWRTAAPARRQWFLAQARTTRDGDGYDAPGIVRRSGRGRTRFTARLRPERPGRHRWVAVIAEGWDAGGLDGPERVVRVSG